MYPNKKINLTRLDELTLGDISSMNFRDIISLYEDVALADISKDEEIKHRPEGLQLHKMNQYAMQYMMYSINQLKVHKKRLEEEGTIMQLGTKEETDLLAKQKGAIDALDKEIKLKGMELDEQKQLIEVEKGRKEENNEMIMNLKQQLMVGRSSLDPTLPDVKEFARVMRTAQI